MRQWNCNITISFIILFLCVKTYMVIGAEDDTEIFSPSGTAMSKSNPDKSGSFNSSLSKEDIEIIQELELLEDLEMLEKIEVLEEEDSEVIEGLEILGLEEEADEKKTD